MKTRIAVTSAIYQDAQFKKFCGIGLTDNVIAAKIGCSRSTAQRRRQALEFPPARPERRYTAAEDKKILSLKTADAAAKIGVSKRAVILRRKWLGRHQ